MSRTPSVADVHPYCSRAVPATYVVLDLLYARFESMLARLLHKPRDNYTWRFRGIAGTAIVADVTCLVGRFIIWTVESSPLRAAGKRSQVWTWPPRSPVWRWRSRLGTSHAPNASGTRFPCATSTPREPGPSKALRAPDSRPQLYQVHSSHRAGFAYRAKTPATVVGPQSATNLDPQPAQRIESVSVDNQAGSSHRTWPRTRMRQRITPMSAN